MTSISTPRPVLAAVAEPAVLDSAHTGDIVGAFGRIGRDAGVSGRWRRLRTLMVISGPGLIVMVGDNDAGGVATYAQAGQNYGMALLWTLVLMIPVLYVNQEMVLRPRAERRAARQQERASWSTPSLGSLTRPTMSPTRKAGLFVLRAYLALAAVLVVVKVAETALT